MERENKKETSRTPGKDKTAITEPPPNFIRNIIEEDNTTGKHGGQEIEGPKAQRQ